MLRILGHFDSPTTILLMNVLPCHLYPSISIPMTCPDLYVRSLILFFHFLSFFLFFGGGPLTSATHPPAPFLFLGRG